MFRLFLKNYQNFKINIRLWKQHAKKHQTNNVELLILQKTKLHEIKYLYISYQFIKTLENN